jgi:hypothetical protein
MSLEWKWGKPDAEGIWLFGGNSGSPRLASVYLYKEIDGWGEGWWCHAGPTPVVQKPKKHRTPKLPDDYGKECEFSDDGFKTHSIDKLTGYNKSEEDYDPNPWKSSGRGYWRDARIEVKD